MEKYRTCPTDYSVDDQNYIPCTSLFGAMSQQNATEEVDRFIEEVQTRAVIISRWKWLVGGLLLIPPFTPLGAGFLIYQFYQAGERVGRN